MIKFNFYNEKTRGKITRKNVLYDHQSWKNIDKEYF